VKTKVVTQESAISGTDQNVSLADAALVTNLLLSIPYEAVDEALCSADRKSRRLGKFSDHMVVYFCVLMGLHTSKSYVHILQNLEEVLEWLSLEKTTAQISDAAIAQARQRVGVEPLKRLFSQIAKPLATPSILDAYYANRRLAVLDGTTFEIPDTALNAKHFGYRANKHGRSACPLVKVVTVMELATRVALDVASGPIDTDEIVLAKEIIARSPSGLLYLADRHFPGTELCQQVIDRQSDFLFRVRSTYKLTPLAKRFADGSYLAVLNNKVENPVTVRVVEYELKGSSERYRLVTSLLDAETAPAIELASLYHRRWDIETFMREVKVDLRAPALVLRSKSPEMVEQELYGLFLAHYVVRSFMFEAWRRSGIPPTILSFKHSIQVIRNQLNKFEDFSP